MKKYLIYIEILSLICFMIFTYFMCLNLSNKVKSVESKDNLFYSTIENESNIAGSINDMYFINSTIKVETEYYDKGSYPFQIILKPLNNDLKNINYSYIVYKDDIIIKESNLEEYGKDSQTVLYEDTIYQNDKYTYKIELKLESLNKFDTSSDSYASTIMIVKK